MNYKKQYIKLIRKASLRSLNLGYTEKHHVFPVSIFGKNKSIVKLTAKEHFIAHHLLWKYYQKKYGNKDHKTIKMMNAIFLMSGACGRINSNTFSILREQKSNNMAGKKVSIETREKLSRANSGKVRSEEVKKRISNTKILANRTGDKSYWFGKKLPDEAKAKMSISQKGKIHSAERNKQKSLSMLGEKNVNFGKTWSLEEKERSRKSHEKQSKHIESINMITGEVREYSSIHFASNSGGFNRREIQRCCKSVVLKSHKGFYWNYLNG